MTYSPAPAGSSYTEKQASLSLKRSERSTTWWGEVLCKLRCQRVGEAECACARMRV